MVTTSLLLSWHWFADLVAGLLVGAVLLQLTVAADTALPRTVLRQSPRDALRRLSSELPRWVRRSRSARTTQDAS